MNATPSASEEINAANRLRAASDSSKKSCAVMRQGVDLRAMAAWPASRAARSSGEMYAQFR
jgi:hypothetical protein